MRSVAYQLSDDARNPDPRQQGAQPGEYETYDRCCGNDDTQADTIVDLNLIELENKPCLSRPDMRY